MIITGDRFTLLNEGEMSDPQTFDEALGMAPPHDGVCLECAEQGNQRCSAHRTEE